MTVPITCPGCGNVAHLEEIRRDASEFCTECDYPLFWARSAAAAPGGSAVTTESGLRRLPGTAGRVAVATVACWSCEEPNPVTNTHCLRCAVDLVRPPEPEPVVEAPPPPPPPPPEPEPERRPVWPWIVLAVVLLAGIVALGLAL